MICTFCGRVEKPSNEHVFGQQFATRFPRVEEHIAAVGHYAEAFEHEKVVKTDEGYVTSQHPRGSREPELHKVQVTVGEVCNNGWMNDLDGAAVNVIEALTAGGGFRPPTADEGEALARWLVKTGMAYDLYQSPLERGYSERLRREFYETRALPPGTTVYLGYEPDELEWVPFWQHGWHVAPAGTSAEEIVSSPPNLSTTLFGLNGLRLVAHRVAPEVVTQIRRAAAEWQAFCMPKSRMVQIASQRAADQFNPMDSDAMAVGHYSLRQFVKTRTEQVAPSKR